MSTPSPAFAAWVKAGLLALFLYGLILAWTTRSPQPDQTTDPEGWAEFVSSRTYLVEHLSSNVVGALLAIWGTAALGFHLSRGLARRAGLWGVVLALVGQVLFMVPGIVSTFVTPPIGAAYLEGHREVMELQFSAALGMVMLVSLLLVVVGNVVLGVAIRRSALLPRWTGALWIIATLVFYVLGAALGIATTGASLPTQPIGGLLMAASAAGMVVAALGRGRPTPVQLHHDATPRRTDAAQRGA